MEDEEKNKYLKLKEKYFLSLQNVHEEFSKDLQQLQQKVDRDKEAQQYKVRLEEDKNILEDTRNELYGN